MKIKIIIPYFGKLHPLFEIYFLGIQKNEKFDFLLITDQVLEYKSLPNLEIVILTFTEFVEKTNSKIDVQPKSPYKLCDFKPFYGIIFEDYLKGYDYWGYSDIDMILGDLDPIYYIASKNSYDKILDLGHLSFYKNIDTVNFFYKIKRNIENQYKYLLNSSIIWVTDESYSNIIFGVNRVLTEFGMKLYSSRDLFFDTSAFVNEFTDSNKEKINPGFIEYKNNKLFFVSLSNKKINKKEIIYSHFLKRVVKVLSSDGSYIIIPYHWKNVNNYDQSIEKLKDDDKFTQNNNYKKYISNKKIKNFIILITESLSSIEAIKIFSKIIKFKLQDLLKKTKQKY